MQKIDLNKLQPLEYLQLKDAISKLDDDATVGPDYAAFYLDMSEKTLANHRQKGAGPEYIQAKTSEARNQSVAYKMRSLRTWQNLNTFTSPMEAAGARGLCRDISNLFEGNLFWVDPEGNFIDNVSDESAKELADSGIEAHVNDVPLYEALSGNWINPGRQIELLNESKSVLDAWFNEVKSGAESTSLMSKIPDFLSKKDTDSL